MASYLETPSRVWRRIQINQEQDMPSLPSLPAFDDSADPHITTSDDGSEDDMQLASPIHSTPAALSNAASTIRAPSSTSSTARFAHSLASRSTKSLSASRGTAPTPADDGSFDISSIPSLPDLHHQHEDIDIHSSDQETEDSSVPEAYLPPTLDDNLEADLDLSDALQSVSRSNSPGLGDRETPRKKSDYDFSVSLRSEPKASPFDKLRNLSFRRPLSRTRTPSLTRTTSSPSSSISNSTPRSTRSNAWQSADTEPPLAALSVPLPRSATASPALPPNVEERDLTQMSLGSEFGDRESEHSINDTELLPEVAQSRSLQQREGGSTDDRYHADDVSEQQSQHSREPTFSSEEAGSADLNGSTGSGVNGSRAMRSPTPLSVAFSSPASALFTPTPAFQPRPRARFGAPLTSTTPQLPTTTPQQAQVRFDTDETPRQQQFEQESSEEQEEGAHVQFEDPATPHAHKRSFLLSVINSTARPRLRYPTPHPGNPSDESQSQSPPSQSLVQATPGVNLRKAFAGVTPRPSAVKRPRLSHPLTQTWNVASDSGSGSESPYDPAVDRASFVSTASSHDLTTHARANASFDPIIGLGERGHGVGRFNASKLNTYLHGLNRRLQEENEMLVARLRAFEEKYGVNPGGSPAAAVSTTPSSSGTPAWDPPQQRRQSGGRRVSAGPALGLGDVAEDVAEAWLEEKAALEEMIEELKEEMETCAADKEKAEEALKTEKDERARDKERWRERMTEVEKGVEGIVADLERRVGEAEEAAKRAEKDKSEGIKDVEHRLAVVLVEKDVLAERLKKAENALESGRELGAEVNAANERLAKVQGELQNAQRQIKELEDEVMRSDARLDDTEAALHAERKRTAALEDELREKMDELTDAVHRVDDLEEDVRKLRAQLRDAESAAAQYEADAAADNARIQDLEHQLAAAQESANQLTAELELEQQENDRLVEEAERSSELARQMETALEAAEKKMQADEQEVATLKSTVASLERAAEKQQERSVSHLGPSASMVALQAEVESLEAELADAHKEIARLQTVIAQSPARKAIEKAKDARIELLEKEKEDLLERLKSVKNQSGIFGTPGRLVNASNMSPMHRQLLNMSFKSPKTPGGPLRDLSWLQNTMQDPTVSPLIAELARLQQELDRANASIDDKLDRLEDAGFGAVDLLKQLEDAREHIVALEDEIARMCRREERRVRRLERLRCRKCRTKIDTRGLQSAEVGDESSILEASTMSMPSEPPTPPTRTTEALRNELKEVNAQLETMKRTWDEERKKLLGENAVLQDAATRLNVEVRNAKDEIRKYADAERLGEKARAGIQGELDKAKRTMAELEAELKAERSRLRALTTEQTKAQREKETLLLDLRRTESDMADVREQLQHIKQENHELEKELRSNATAEQKARLLEAKVAENLENMEQLRQERSMLAADHKELQRRYAKASEEVNRLKSEFAASQTSHDNRRHELDLRALEIEDLRRALSDQATELERVEAEKARLAAEKGDVARTVAALEADLRRVRRDAEAFGRDLKALRAQKDKMEAEKKEERTKAERAQKQAQAQIRILKEELDGHKEKARELQKQWKGHVCAADDRQLVALKQQHNKECKGLMVQIRYLKAKFTREWTFRCDLGYQKQYLLVLMARLERNEEKILAAIARIGYPTIVPNPTPPKIKNRKFRSVVDTIVFIHRSRRASEQWRQHRSAKPAIEAALQEVRKQRAANGTAATVTKATS